MICPDPKCMGAKPKVTNRVNLEETNQIKRRYECRLCKKRWTTYETVEGEEHTIPAKPQNPVNNKRLLELLDASIPKRDWRGLHEAK